MSESITSEFPLSTETKQLGFSRIYAIDKTLSVCDVKTEIQCRYHMYDLQKTMLECRLTEYLRDQVDRCNLHLKNLQLRLEME